MPTVSASELLPPRLRTLLARTKLRLNTALPFGGTGDRASRAKGSGLEFAEHRPYQPGDELKHVDPHLEARLGEPFIRQYSVDQQLPVTILLDRSASMEHGHPAKFRFAQELAAALGYLALAGNDRVRLAAYAGKRLLVSPLFSGVRNIEPLCAWLVSLTAGGTAELAGAVDEVMERLPRNGLVIVISDWLAQDVGRLPTMLWRPARDVLAVHVHAPDERDPALLATGGDLNLVDAETGEEMDVSLSGPALDEYRLAWLSWRDSLREELLSQRSFYVSASSDTALETMLLADWMKAGLVGR